MQWYGKMPKNNVNIWHFSAKLLRRNRLEFIQYGIVGACKKKKIEKKTKIIPIQLGNEYEFASEKSPVDRSAT